MTNALHVAVIGGGIGGLAAAAALSRHGAKVSLFERAERFDDVGSGIAMFANAMRSLAALGAAEDVKAQGNAIHRMSILTPDGKVLVTDDVSWHEAVTGMPSILIRRPALHAALRAAVPPECARAPAPHSPHGQALTPDVQDQRVAESGGHGAAGCRDEDRSPQCLSTRCTLAVAGLITRRHPRRRAHRFLLRMRRRLLSTPAVSSSASRG